MRAEVDVRVVHLSYNTPILHHYYSLNAEYLLPQHYYKVQRARVRDTRQTQTPEAQAGPFYCKTEAGPFCYCKTDPTLIPSSPPPPSPTRVLLYRAQQVKLQLNVGARGFMLHTEHTEHNTFHVGQEGPKH